MTTTQGSTYRVTAAMCARGRIVAEPRLSPDGRWVAFVATTGGRGYLVLVPSTGGPEVTLSSEPPVCPSAAYGGGIFDWHPSSESLVYVGMDGSLYLQPVTGGPARQIHTGGGSVAAPAISPDGTKVAYSLDAAELAVASLVPGGPWPVRLSDGADFCFDPAWSPDGTTVAWHEWDVPAMPWDDSRIVVAAAGGAAKPVPIPLGDGRHAVGQPRFSPDGLVLGFLCDAGGWLNLWQADPGGTVTALLSEEAEAGGPSWGQGQRSWAWSPDGRRVVFCRNEAGFGRLCLLDLATDEVSELDRGVFYGLSWVGDRIAAVRTGARTPDQVVVYTAPAGATAGFGPVGFAEIDSGPIVLARGPLAGFEAADLVEPEVVSWSSEDIAGIGTIVHGRLFTSRHRMPALPGDGPNPLIVWVHGGPTAQDQVTFNTRAAFFLDRGWNILRVDHRGSTGWGRAYAQALRGEWGRLDILDTVAGIETAIERGWGRRGSIAIMGGSAGGFAVLNTLAASGALCAAAVDLYGVTDLFDLDETTHRFEAHYLISLVGTLPENAARYRDRSPINQVASITTPLLVLQGSADNVVPLAQSDALVDALRAEGASVDYHVYEGEGHGWSRPEVLEDELGRIEEFLTRHVLRRR